MTELKYEKIINDSLCSVISNNDKIINNYKQIVSNNNNTIKSLEQKINKKTVQRNIALGTTIALLIGFLLK